jgi:hypothetical protein
MLDENTANSLNLQRRLGHQRRDHPTGAARQASSVIRIAVSQAAFDASARNRAFPAETTPAPFSIGVKCSRQNEIGPAPAPSTSENFKNRPLNEHATSVSGGSPL